MFSSYYDLANGTSYLFLGDYEQSKLLGNISWLPLKNTSSFWDLSTTDLTYNGKKMGTMASSCTVDSGTSLAYFPQSVYDAIKKEAGNCSAASNGILICKCNGISDIKSFKVNFNGTSVETEAKYWVLYDS